MPAPVSAETNLRIGGTGSALGTMKLIADAYEKSHPGIKIHIMPSLGSTAGIKAVLAGAIDLGFSSRPMSESELQQGALATEYARTPFIFITHPKVSKKGITTKELETIYSRPESAWPDGSRIRLILRPEKDMDTTLISSISPGVEQGMKAALARPGMIMAITDQEATDSVARTSASLGASTLGEIISEKRAVNILSFNGVPPSVKTLADRSYPLTKSLYLVTASKTSAEARRFTEFILSPAAAKILKENGNMAVKARQ